MARIALGQINLTVGDLAGNVERMASMADRATQAGADVVAFPELAVTGYPPEDLVHRGEFVRENLEALDALARKTATACPVITGFVDRTDAGLHNAAALLRKRPVESRYHKCSCRTSASSTSGATSCPATTAPASRSAGSRSACRCARTPGTTPSRSRATRDCR